MIGLMVTGVGFTRGKKEILSTRGMQEMREGIAMVVELEIEAGIGIGAEEGVVDWLNSMAMVVIVGVLVRGRYWGEG